MGAVRHFYDSLTSTLPSSLSVRVCSSSLSASTSFWYLAVHSSLPEDLHHINQRGRHRLKLSSYVTSLLFSLCQELNRIGAHALDRKLLHELVTSLSRGVLTSHEKLIQENKPSITQNQALQVLFDLKVLTAILVGRGEDETSEFTNRREQVIESLESCVDPFDLDVFTPYVALNVSRQLQRCGVLFGVVASLDKHSTHSFGATQRPSSGSHDQHNVMPLAPNPPRFTLLPLSFHLSPEIGPQTADLTRKMGPSRSQGEGFVTRTAFFNHQQFFNKNNSCVNFIVHKGGVFIVSALGYDLTIKSCVEFIEISGSFLGSLSKPKSSSSFHLRVYKYWKTHMSHSAAVVEAIQRKIRCYQGT
ncbi:Conserved oligomeric Golgi complex subunit 1 [Acropora cervicornis]|uniref:Conserved oligomeric Golgi complex subunit 1 n=1 Tax=Acropora cervicornis TaxID=6130 RepID=A0AAD9QN67_ACRCE|nr:Conserved oligomeric Golgi complex subunit 1 [Acropora cervicornis]